ncbi:hypothetical protein O181_109557 [Austropuccinia psidii MF-1]|uniref:Uncharacterized protein n=1 Tax=Austropuccinia psidii MF-1 TaxID=1389203 RepID=A0A9Q3PRI1_9BASI|nr:hypothetical protein [Austropuccinia psidii MF-1]
MSPVHLRNLGILKNHPEDRQGIFKTRKTGSGHHSGWKDTMGNHTPNSIHLPIKQRPQTKGLEADGSSSSDQPTPRKVIPIEHGQKEVQPSLTLGTSWRRLKEYMSQRDDLKRLYVNHQRMGFQQEVQATGGKDS